MSGSQWRNIYLSIWTTEMRDELLAVLRPCTEALLWRCALFLFDGFVQLFLFLSWLLPMVGLSIGCGGCWLEQCTAPVLQSHLHFTRLKPGVVLSASLCQLIFEMPPVLDLPMWWRYGPNDYFLIEQNDVPLLISVNEGKELPSLVLVFS